MKQQLIYHFVSISIVLDALDTIGNYSNKLVELKLTL